MRKLQILMALGLMGFAVKAMLNHKPGLGISLLALGLIVLGVEWLRSR